MADALRPLALILELFFLVFQKSLFDPAGDVPAESGMIKPCEFRNGFKEGGVFEVVCFRVGERKSLDGV